MMKIDKFRGDVTDVSAKKAALVRVADLVYACALRERLFRETSKLPLCRAFAPSLLFQDDRLPAFRSRGGDCDFVVVPVTVQVDVVNAHQYGVVVGLPEGPPVRVEVGDRPTELDVPEDRVLR